MLHALDSDILTQTEIIMEFFLILYKMLHFDKTDGHDFKILKMFLPCEKKIKEVIIPSYF